MKIYIEVYKIVSPLIFFLSLQLYATSQNNIEYVLQQVDLNIENKITALKTVVDSIVQLSDAQPLFQSIISAAKATEDSLLLANVFTTLAKAEKKSNHFQNALAYFQEAILYWKTTDDEVEVAKCLYNSANVLKEQENYIAALDYYEQSLKILQEHNAPLQWMIYHAKGKTYLKTSQYDKALTQLDIGLKLAQQQENELGIASLLLDMGELNIKIGNYKKAIELTKNSLVAYEALDNKVGAAKASNNLGSVYLFDGNQENSLSYYLQALSYEGISKDLANRIKNNVNTIAYEAGQYNNSLEAYQEILKSEDQNKKSSAYATFNIGNIYYLKKEYEKAIQYHRDALQLARNTGNKELEMNAMRRMTDDFYYLKEIDSARLYMDQWMIMEEERLERLESVKVLTTNLEEEKRKVAQRNSSIIMLAALASLILVLAIAALLTYRERSKRRFAEKDREQKVNEALKDVEIKISNAKLDAMNDERERIGKHIHDSVGVILASTKLHFEALGKKLDGLEANKRKRFDDAYELLSEAQKETRRIIYDMANLTLQRNGLIAQIKELTNTVQSSGLIKVELNVKGLEKRLDPEVAKKMYRIIQELTGNALKYSKASQLDIDIELVENQLAMSFKDNGVGFDPDKVDKGFGLNAIEGSVNNLRGKMNIDSQRGKGTVVRIEQISLN